MKSKTDVLKKIQKKMILIKKRDFLPIFLPIIDYENISIVLCTSERGQMNKLDKVAANKNFKFEGGGGVFL